MERITNRLADILMEHKLNSRIGNTFDAGIVEGIKIAKDEVEKIVVEIKNHEEMLKVTGVCGICGVQHRSYHNASKCCSHLKGKDYDRRINQVFKM